MLTYQAVQEGRLLFAEASDEADNGNDSVNFDRFERLCHGGRASNLNNVLYASLAGRQALGLLTPVRVLFVVNDVVGAVLLEQLSLLL